MKICRSFANRLTAGCRCAMGSGAGQSAVAFTLIELLVVISIMGILAGIAVPALKNLGKSNVQMSASRQLLDDIGRARQLALSQHTTVYMVFVPANFWLFPNGWWNGLSAAQKNAGTNLCDKQYAGYTFLSLRSVGDQPGQGVPRYLAAWQTLPDGTFIASNKFSIYSEIRDTGLNITYPVNAFHYTNNLPFPTEANLINTATYPNVWLPYIAFNYRGQLTVDGINVADYDEYIPLAQGIVGYAMDVNKKLILDQADARENPPGNSTNSMFTLVHIDRLTGRATLLSQKVQ